VHEYLKDKPHLDAMEDAMRVYRYTWETLTGIGEISLADDVLMLASQTIQDCLDKNRDPALQEIYLARPHHAVIWEAWEEKRDR
jgi:hypothetical protein